MPELPEVETVRRGLEAVLPGRTIEKIVLHRADLRQPFSSGIAELKGQTFAAIKRRAKYLLLELESGDVLLSHLGMSGTWIVRKPGEYELQKHDHVVMTLSPRHSPNPQGILGESSLSAASAEYPSRQTPLRLDSPRISIGNSGNDGVELVFRDPRRFGVLLLEDQTTIRKHNLLSHLGPEPLKEAFSVAYLKEALAKRSGPVKTVLMDQQLVVGVGNIYASEALYRIGVHPAMPARKAAKHAEALVKAIQAVLKEAIKSGGSTLRNYAQASGDTGHFQHHFKVYGRDGKPCPACGTPIRKITQAGRSSFFCPKCQK